MKNINNFLLKISIFTAEKNRRILHGHVLVTVMTSLTERTFETEPQEL